MFRGQSPLNRINVDPSEHTQVYADYERAHAIVPSIARINNSTQCGCSDFRSRKLTRFWIQLRMMDPTRLPRGRPKI